MNLLSVVEEDLCVLAVGELFVLLALAGQLLKRQEHYFHLLSNAVELLFCECCSACVQKVVEAAWHIDLA